MTRCVAVRIRNGDIGSQPVRKRAARAFLGHLETYARARHGAAGRVSHFNTEWFRVRARRLLCAVTRDDLDM